VGDLSLKAECQSTNMNKLFIVIFFIALISAVPKSFDGAFQVTPDTPEISPSDRKILEFEKDIIVTIPPKESRTFVFRGTAGEFFRVDLEINETYSLPKISLYSPSGDDLLKKHFGTALILPETGEYLLVMRQISNPFAEESVEDEVASMRASKRFSTTFKNSKRKTWNIGDYTANIYRFPPDSDFDERVAFEILLGGKRVYFFEEWDGGNLQINEEIANTLERPNKRSAEFWSQRDKTGDGSPDIVIQNYTGGAHCCFEYKFIELKTPIKILPMVETQDVDLEPIDSARGGLIFKTAETVFSYWNTSFAESPMPLVFLKFENGELVVDSERMRRPPPSPEEVGRMAAQARGKINLTPYAGYENSDSQFEEPFWAPMLDLIYSGNEVTAWQYFDQVWPEAKQGKERFRAEFKKTLGDSIFYKQVNSSKP